MQLGERLREARQAKGWSLRALGEKTGFSASFLSQVELGQSSPSLGSLEKIANALGLSLGAVIAGTPQPSPVLRKARREGVRSEWSKAYVESLVPTGSDEHIQSMLLRLEAGGRTGENRTPLGCKTFAYVTSGQAQVNLSEPPEELSLEAGDSLLIEGPRGVCWQTTDTTLEVLVVTARVT